MIKLVYIQIYRAYIFFRFGPGLVVYWFGFVETIIEPTEKRFIVREDVPTNIVLLNPNIIQVPSL